MCFHADDSSEFIKPMKSFAQGPRKIVIAQNKGSRESLTLCPLRFTDKSMESQFALNQERTARFRNLIAGVLSSFLVVVDAGACYGAWRAGIIMHDPSMFWSFLICLALALILCIAFAFSYRIPYIRHYVEYASYVMATLVVMLKSFSVVAFKAHMYSEKCFLNYGAQIAKLYGLEFNPQSISDWRQSTMYQILVTYTELFLDVFVQSTIVFVLLLFDVLAPARFFIASWLLGLNTLIGIAPFVYGAVQPSGTFLPK